MDEIAATAPHAPRTTVLKRILGPFYFTGVFWYRLHLLGVRVLPDWALASVVFCFTVACHLALGNVRRAIAFNRALVEGPAGFLARQRGAFRTLHAFAWCLTERYEQFVPSKRFDVRVEGENHWREATAGGRGLIVATAHVGNWELGSHLPVTHEARTVHLVREAEMDPRSQAFVRALLRSAGGACYRTHFASDDLALGVTLLDALRAGVVVALQFDRPRSGGQVESVPFLDRVHELPVGPAALARSAGVAIVPAFTLREGRRRYRLRLCRPIAVASTADRAQDVRIALSELARELEGVLRETPEQWFCFREIAARAPPRAEGRAVDR